MKLATSVYTVYQTTCLANGKIYIGVHKTRDPDDDYLGSGSLFGEDVAKYGEAQFQKEVLHTYETFEEAYAKEGELVDRAFVKRADTYNLKVGGVHSSGFYRNQGGEKNTQWGTVWIHKEGEPKPRKISEGSLALYQDLGWQRGRGPEFGSRLSDVCVLPKDPFRPNNSGMKKIHSKTLGVEKLVPDAQLLGSLGNGWEMGSHPKSVAKAVLSRLTTSLGVPKRVRLVNQGEIRLVLLEEVPAFGPEWVVVGRRIDPRKTVISASPPRKATGETHGSAKLDEKKVAEIRELNGKMTHQEIGDRYGVSHTAVGLILRGKTWKNKSESMVVAG